MVLVFLSEDYVKASELVFYSNKAQIAASHAGSIYLTGSGGWVQCGIMGVYAKLGFCLEKNVL